MAQSEHDSWFQGGGLGWFVRSLLWAGQCGAVVAITSFVLDARAGVVAGFIVALVFLFYHINALISERVR